MSIAQVWSDKRQLVDGETRINATLYTGGDDRPPDHLIPGTLTMDSQRVFWSSLCCSLIT